MQGVVALAAGRPSYANYWGGAVFPPVAIALGLGAIALAWWLPDKPRQTRTGSTKPRMRFPHEDARKW
jgi:hypothetical protein